MTNFASTFHWREPDEDELQLGEGLSRAPAEAKTEAFTVMVKSPGARPMRLTLQAETEAHALRYASARWPKAHIYAPAPD